MLRLLLVGLIVVSTWRAEAPDQDKGTTKPKGTLARAKVRAEDVPGYKVQVIEGFTVLLSAETVKNQEASKAERKPFEVLELELKSLVSVAPPRALTALRNVLVWVEWDEKSKLANGRQGLSLAVYLGGHQLGMVEKGQHPLKAKNVTILRMTALTEEHQPKVDSGRCVILHEMAHAVHDQLLDYSHPGIKAAYKQAMERKLYDPKMYASTNEPEFFAEMTCAYFDQLNYYPHNGADLKKHDPATYKLMESIWGKRAQVAAKTGPSSSPLPEVSLDKIDLGQSVLGPKVSLADLKERAVMVLLWNAKSTTSLACFTKVNAWNAELGDFGLVTVGVHLTGKEEQNVPAAAQSRGAVFAIANARWIAGGLVKEFKEFPRCLVFDHEGQCTFFGSPFDAEPALRSAVGKALVAKAALEQTPKPLTVAMESLRKGKSPTLALPDLVTLANSGDAETAKAAKHVVTLLTERGRKDIEEAEPLLKSDPVAAFLKLERLPVVFKGTLVAVKANDWLTKLKADKAVMVEQRARTALAAIRKLDRELSGQPGSFDPTLPKFRDENAALLKQLKDSTAQMQKNWPMARATAEAGDIAKRYGCLP